MSLYVIEFTINLTRTRSMELTDKQVKDLKRLKKILGASEIVSIVKITTGTQQ